MSNPPMHSQYKILFILYHPIVIIVLFLKMGDWEIPYNTLYARVLNILIFFARIVNSIKLPCSHFNQKSLRLWEVASLDCSVRVWECMGGSNV